MPTIVTVTNTPTLMPSPTPTLLRYSYYELDIEYGWVSNF